MNTSPPPSHTLTVPQTLRQWQTDLESGLTETEATKRLAQYGANVLSVTKKTHWYTVLVRQFYSVLIFILLIATGIALSIGKIEDAITILAIVILNGILGFIQEWKAEKAMAALQRMLSPRCMVIRNQTEQEIDARDLVPGDIVLLEIGNRVPADLRLTKTINLKIDESTLTGESKSVNKDTDPTQPKTILAEQSSMAWMGTSVTNGRATGVVVATNMETEFGRIAQLTQTVGKEVTPLQRKLARLGKQLGILSVIVSAVVCTIGWVLGKPLFTMFFTGVSLAVAVVPEGLPTVVIITMALGIRAMAKRRALLRRLQSAETLGSATVICTDKTGTLTKNEMTVTQIWLPNKHIEVAGTGYDPSGHFTFQQEKIDISQHRDLLTLLETGMVCNHAKLLHHKDGWHQLGEPTEAALMTAAYKAELRPQTKPNTVSEFSFNSTRKRMSVILYGAAGNLAYVKGAPEVILQRSSKILDNDTTRLLTEQDKQHITQAYNEMAKNGLRTLALAKRILPEHIEMNEDSVEQELTFLGIVGIMDPPRSEVTLALKTAHQAGIKTIMITGDAAPTAKAIAERIGMTVQRVITGAELMDLSDTQLKKTLKHDVVFARTTPEHKLRIVQLLQQQGHVVGMTGDGVNDAPALKKADIGIAMGLRGTDVAKGAADMILTDDNFASIIGAIEEGRRQYNNIKKFVGYLLSSNLAEIVAILFNILMGSPLILLPVQILWMNFITDGITAIALGMEPFQKNLMREQPQKSSDPILNKKRIGVLLILGCYMGLATLWLFHHYGETTMIAQTAAFTGLILFEKTNVFNFRSFSQPLSTIGFFSNPWLLLAVLLNVGLQICAVYVPVMQKMLHTTPLPISVWGMIILWAAPIFIVVEGAKWIKRRT